MVVGFISGFGEGSCGGSGIFVDDVSGMVVGCLFGEADAGMTGGGWESTISSGIHSSSSLKIP